MASSHKPSNRNVHGAPTRYNRQLELSAEAFRALDEVRIELGMTQKQLFSRVIEWFAQQEKESQHLIVGRLPDRYCSDAAMRLAKRTLELRQIDPNQLPPRLD